MKYVDAVNQEVKIGDFIKTPLLYGSVDFITDDHVGISVIKYIGVDSNRVTEYREMFGADGVDWKQFPGRYIMYCTQVITEEECILGVLSK